MMVDGRDTNTPRVTAEEFLDMLHAVRAETPRFAVGERVREVRPWFYHGEPDTRAARHTGTVIPGHFDHLGYVTVALDEGPPVAYHPYDVERIEEE